MKNPRKTRILLIVILVVILIAALLLSFSPRDLLQALARRSFREYNNLGMQGFQDDGPNITLHNFWHMSAEDEANIKTIFKQIFADVKKDVCVYSVFGDPPAEKDTTKLYVQYSGESWHKPLDFFDVNFVPEIPNDTNSVVLYPYAAFQMHINAFNPEYDLSRFTDVRPDANPSNFCLFSVSNCGNEDRNSFFRRLSKYKKVDSCGKCLTNMESGCPGGHSDLEYLNFVSKYKFMICFENETKPHYFTEKLMNAYYAGTIPIYRGDTTILTKINPRAILHLPEKYEDSDVESLIQEIMRLDNDDAAYKSKRAEPLFLDDFPDNFKLDKLRNQVNILLSQNA